MKFVFGNQTGNDWEPLQTQIIGNCRKKGKIWKNTAPQNDLPSSYPPCQFNSKLPLKIILDPWKFGDSYWKPSFSAAFQGGASWLPPFLSFGKVVAESAVVLSCGALAALRDPNRIQKVDKNSGNRGTVL